MSSQARPAATGSHDAECEIRVFNREQASVRAGQGEYSGQPNLDEALEERLRAAPTSLDYGQALFNALLPAESDLRAGYRDALAVAKHKGQPLRVHLFVEATAPPELHRLRWERLYDEKKNITLAHSREVLLSRYAGVSGPLGTTIQGTPKLLVAIANPTDLSDFKLDSVDPVRSRQAIEEALAPLAGMLSYEILTGPVTAAALSDRLVGGKFHALHLQAHGRLPPGQALAELVLEGPGGKADFVGEDFFSQVFTGNPDLRLVTLMACHGAMQSSDDPFSGLGPALVKCGIPAVLAMREAVAVETAQSFCQAFYRNLARTGMVDRATNEARHQLFLSLRDSDEWAMPILFMRLEDGRLWEGGESPARKPGQVFAGWRSDSSPVPWQALLASIEGDNLVPILGPEVSRGLLLSREEIAEHWVAAYDGFPLDRRTDLPAVAQFVETKEGMGFPHDELSRLLARDLIEREKVQHREELKKLPLPALIERISERHFDRDEDEPHRILAELPISTYVTTNWDTFMAAALRWKTRSPRREHCLWRDEMADPPADYADLRGTFEKPLVFHLYGSSDDSASLVLTEDNHLDFLRAISKDETRLPLFLRKKLTQSMLLFLGYDIRRLHSRVLLRGIVAQREKKIRERIALVQIDPYEADAPRAEELKVYIAGCFNDVSVQVLWVNVQEFLVALRDRWKTKNG